MDALIEAIRAATALGATDEARAAGAHACRTILTALEAKAGEPLAAPVATPTQALASVIRGMSPDQLLDLAIARLKAALPPGSEAAPVQSVKFNLVPVGRP